MTISCDRIWVNCPRYVHKHKRVEASKYVPVCGKETPLALWKRTEMVQDVLVPEDKARAEAEGLINLEEYEARVMRGEG